MFQLNRSGFFAKHVARIITVSCFSLLLFIETGCTQNKTTEQNKQADTSAQKVSDLFKDENFWKAPDTLLIPKNDSGNMILYGRSLIIHTSDYFGPHGSITPISNGMNCQNCHLDAGTKPFGNNFSAVASGYPKFKPRSGKMESVEKKISDCFERSLNGKTPDTTGKEVGAMVAYFRWLGSNVKKNETPKGSGIAELPFLGRAADPEKGKIIFQQKCVSCHGNDGQGKMNASNKSYQYPPLWGDHSFNNGASLYRLSKFAGYVRVNMPFITTPENPHLTDEQAWDVAAFVNSMQRPVKDLSNDWPDISKKPFDHPFGPYADTFSETQHKFGPFAGMPSAKRKK